MDTSSTILALLGIAVFFALVIVVLNPERWYTEWHKQRGEGPRSTSGSGPHHSSERGAPGDDT